MSFTFKKDYSPFQVDILNKGGFSSIALQNSYENS
jgi:hypothetical protein